MCYVESQHKNSILNGPIYRNSRKGKDIMKGGLSAVVWDQGHLRGLIAKEHKKT